MACDPEIHPSPSSQPSRADATAPRNGDDERVVPQAEKPVAVAPRAETPTPEKPAPEKPVPEKPTLAVHDIERLIESRHDDPYHVLGPHVLTDGLSTVVRAFLPGADRVVLVPADAALDRCNMRAIHPDGLFEGRISGAFPSLDYKLLVTYHDQPPVHVTDPYRFRTVRFTAEDERLFIEGRHNRLFETLGAWPQVCEGVTGVAFGVWAPNAARVSVVGSFNTWDGRRHPMQRVVTSGIWELFVPGAAAGDFYKYEIKTNEGAVFLKSDPFAACAEPVPPSASIVADIDTHEWADATWMRERRLAQVRERGVLALSCTDPLSVGPDLPDGHTCLALSPVFAGPVSGGLLTCGAPLETPAAWMAWINSCHRRGIGVALTVEGSSFSIGAEELAWFDGTRLYERAETTGSTPRFDLAKGEVRSVLASSLLFWIEKYHVDAFITDVAGMRVLETLADDVYTRFLGFRVIIRPDPADSSSGLSRDIGRIANGRHDDPFSVLGLHETPKAASAAGPAERKTTNGTVIRTMQPGAAAVHVLPVAPAHLVYEMARHDAAGLFEVGLPTAVDYRLRVFDDDGGSREIIDPYGLQDCLFGADDQHLFAAGNHYRIYEKLGAHPRRVDDVEGVTFAVWAPEAEGVGVVGPFNDWNGLTHQMKRHGVSGVWEIFVPGVGEGALYKFEIRSRNGHVVIKSDPYAVHTEVPPATASIVYRMDGVHLWADETWLERRRNANPWAAPMSIYELHLGSWMRGNSGERLSYRELAKKLVPYVKALGFTHIELMPIAEHPYEPSWGYQVSHFYAPTARFGTPADLMALIDHCHVEGIGVILDWVPGHFPKDAHGLAWFDGSHVYEHADPRQGEHPDWGTLIFNYGRHEVENFLIANALFWLETYHFDGLRVDAVASMLYLDYSRPAYGGWIPNMFGGKENLDAIEFLKHTNSILHQRFPGILMIAEESTSWPNVSRPIDMGGLGFGFKWNMGWMHDTLAYMSVPPADRHHHHNRLTFSIVYAFAENFILALSHDEVVHLKRSLLGKMPGEEWEKFANLRLLFTYMYAHPGKKLLFMGSELGQEGEWSHEQGLEWRALEHKLNRALSWFFKDLNQLYRATPALHEVDFKPAGFEWLEVDNSDESIIAFVRKARDPRRALVFAANFSNISRPAHRIGVPYPVDYTVLFDSNAERYGGRGSPPSHRVVMAEEQPWHGRDFSICLSLPALSAVILEPAPLATA